MLKAHTDPDDKPVADEAAVSPAGDKTPNADWQSRARGIARRIWEESRAVAVVTFRHASRLGRQCWLLGQRQLWRWRLHRQKLSLGEQMYQRGIGDGGVRAQIQHLDQQIEAAKSEKQSVRPLNRSRKALLIQFAGGLSDSESKEVQSAAQGVQVLTRELKDLDGKLEAEDNRPSPSPTERLRVGIGYAVLLLAALLSWTLAYNGKPSGRGQPALSYYPKTCGLLRRASQVAIEGDKEESKGTAVQRFADLQQRGYLLSEIADSQAVIGDIEGVDESLAGLYELDAIAERDLQSDIDISSAATALAIAYVHQEDWDSVERCLHQLESTDPVEGMPKTLARALSKVAIAAAQCGNDEKATAFLDRLQRIAGDFNPAEHVFALGELASAQVLIGFTGKSWDVVDQIVDLREASSSQNGNSVRDAANSALAAVAIRQATAGEREIAEYTVKLIEASELSRNGAWFGIGKVQAEALAYDSAYKLISNISDDLTQAHLALTIASSSARLGKHHRVGAYLQLAQKIHGQYAFTPAGRRLFFDFCMVMAGCGEDGLVQDPTLKLSRPEEEARVLALYAVSVAKRGESEEAEELLSKVLSTADSVDVTETRRVFEEIGRRFVESGLWLEDRVLKDERISGLAQAALMLGAARAIMEAESVAHAANEGVVAFGRIQTEPGPVTVPNAELQKWFAHRCESTITGGADARPDYWLHESGGVLVVPTSKGLDYAIPPSEAGLDVPFEHGLPGAPVDEARLLFESVGHTIEYEGLVAQSRLIARKYMAVRPIGWVVFSIEGRNDASPDGTAK